MRDVYILATGAYAPEHTITNEELVQSYNQYVTENPDLKLPLSDAEFIEKASGIKSRHAFDKENCLDTKRMRPYFAPREDSEISRQAEFALQAIKPALEKANLKAEDVDCIICACSNLQRAYPAIAIEIQHYLGAKGYAFDMNVACSSATFAITHAVASIQSGLCDTIVVVNPELCTGQLNFCDRDSHFIFGDACAATVLSSKKPTNNFGFKIESCQLQTEFSSNIRNNWGFLNTCEQKGEPIAKVSTFSQNGRKVFKEVVPKVCEHITAHLAKHQCNPADVARFWLHQANINMNQLVMKKLLGDNIAEETAPNILAEFANTGSPGAILAFHYHHQNLTPGQLGILCSFGAGYSVGSILVRKE